MPGRRVLPGSLVLAAVASSSALLCSRGVTAPPSRGSAITASSSQQPPPGTKLSDLSGASLNEEERVTVTYSGSAKSRERRVRRTRRPNKEERWQTSSEPVGFRRMSAFCTADTINLEDAVQALTGFSSYGERLSITSYTDVVHCRFQKQSELPLSEPPVIRDAFLFPYGATILWGFSSEQELRFLEDLTPCCEPISLYTGTERSKLGVAEDDDELADSEFMLYELVDGDDFGGASGGGGGDLGGELGGGGGRNSGGGGIGGGNSGGSSVALSNNVIRLSARDDVFEKLAISFAFAQSAKLAVFEAALEATTDEIRPIPNQLAQSGRSKFSENELARLTGRVFLERNAVNLYSNILDTPDFFWEAEEFEPLYRRVNRYLDIESRVDILNKRLDIVNDLLDSLSSQLEVRQGHRLEVIIIGLIMLEIALEVLKESMLPPLALWPRRLLMLPLMPWRLLRAIGSGVGPAA